MRLNSFKTYGISPATALALIRIVFFGFLAYVFFISKRELGLFGLPEAHWRQTFWFDLLDIPRLGYLTVEKLRYLWITALICSSLGFLYRTSSALSFFLGCYILNGGASTAGELYLWNYSTGMPVVWMLVLMFTHAHDRISIDSLLFKRRRNREPFDYVWPIFLLRVLFVFPFFFSALHRFIRHGFDLWVSDHLLNLITIKYFSYCSDNIQGFSCRLIEHIMQWPVPVSISYCISQIIEGATIFLPFAKKCRWVVLPALLVMQIGIFFLLFENFRTFIPLYFAWVPIKNVEPRDIYRLFNKP